MIVLALMAYQSVSAYANHLFESTYNYMWSLLSYAAMVLCYMLCGMIIAYNEGRSGKSPVTKFVLLLIAVFLIIYPFGLIKANIVVRNAVMLKELTRVLSLVFGIMTARIKL